MNDKERDKTLNYIRETVDICNKRLDYIEYEDMIVLKNTLKTILKEIQKLWTKMNHTESYLIAIMNEGVVK